MVQVNPWRRFLKLLQIEKKDIYAIYFYAIAGGILSMSLPLGIQSVIRFIQSGQITTSWVVLIVLVIAGAILTGVMQIMQLRITENIQQRIFVNYSFDFAHRFPRFKRNELNGENPDELVNRFFDIMGLQKGIVFSLLVLSLYHPFYIAFSVLLVVMLALIFKPFIRRGLETSLKESKHKYATAYWLQEITRNSWSFRMAPNENLSLERLDESTSDYVRSREAHFQILMRQFIWTIGFKVLIITSLLGLGGYLVISQQINLGQFVAAEVLILLLLAAVEKVIQSMDNLYDVCTSLEKLEQVRDIPVLCEENHSERQVELFPIEIVRKDGGSNVKSFLTLKEGDKMLLKGNNRFEVEHFLKSSIENTESANFITRWNFIIPTNQELESIYRQIGWFSSDSRVIDGTLLENITLQRPEITTREVKHVLELLEITHIYVSSAEGLRTPAKKLEERLTPDERERLLLSRAIIHKPKFLVLSFWDSSISAENQRALLEKISAFIPKTAILCAGCDHMNNWSELEINLQYDEKI
jgi:ABC-type bacteriocin/lantibiotic exporter with double-glycine peptidase domain